MKFIKLSKSYSRSVIKDVLDLLERHGIDVSVWRPEITYGTKVYTQKDVEKWKNLYEKFGSYNYIKDFLRKEEEDGPADSTIKERLKEYFQKKKLDFESWEELYKRNIKLQKYGEKEELYWIRLYEKLGSFYQVSEKLEEKYGKIIRSSSIKERIKKRFLREKKNFNEWEQKYRRRNPSQFESIYSEEDVNLWIKLFEKYGFISKVIEKFENLNDKNQLSNGTILYRIEKKFEEEVKDFEKWYEKYRRSTKNFEKKYEMENVNEWETLFEEIGSFSGVSHYLNGLEGSEDIPNVHTIKAYLKEKFKKEERDFKKWVIEYYSPNHKRSNIIGNMIHFIMEFLFIKYQLNIGNAVFYEISPTDERDTIIDNALLELNNKIKMKCIDYSTSKYKENIYDKMYKNYQSIYRELIIVPLLIDDEVKISKTIKKNLRKNVKILNKDEFAKWVGYNNEELEIYYRAIELAKSALFDDDDFAKLRKLGKKAQYNLHKLEDKYPIGEKGFIKYLKNVNGKDYSYILKGLKFNSLEDF